MKSSQQQKLENIIFGILSVVVLYGAISLIFSIIDWATGTHLLWQPMSVSSVNHSKTLPSLVWMGVWALPLVILLPMRQILVIAHRKEVMHLKQKFEIEERERQFQEAEARDASAKDEATKVADSHAK